MGLARNTGERKMKNLWIIGAMVMLCGVFAIACGDDDETSNGPDGDGGTDAGGECVEYSANYGQVCAHEIGECMIMEDCSTGYCEVYTVAPWSTDAKCMAAPAVNTMNVVGTVRDFETNAVLSDVTASFADGATVLLNPEKAYEDPLYYKFRIVSDANGEFNTSQVWEVQEGDMGVVSLIKKDGYFFTGTGFVESEDLQTPTGTLNHHAIVIPEDLVATLKALADADPAAAKYKPNVFGKVLYADLLDGSGKPLPVQGATIKNTTGSGMEIFYVDEDMGGLTATSTASHGMFIVANIASKDKLRAYRCDQPIDYYDSTMGDTPQDLVYAVMVPVYSADDPDAPEINCN
jgi:hypothetical protein